MENTAENKFKYFAQHYGQRVLVTPSEMKVKVNSNSLIDSIVNLGFLELTPLSDITDEDAIEVAKMSGYDFLTVIDRQPSGDVILKPTKEYCKKNQWESNQTIQFYSETIQFYSETSKVIYDNGESWDDNWNFDLGLKVYDYLRKHGYAIPYLDASMAVFSTNLINPTHETTK